MKCFLCQFEADIPTLKDHYQKYHLIDSTNENFLNIFKPDYLDFNCSKCHLNFTKKEDKTKHMFLKHFNEKNQIQFGGYRNIISLNVLKRGKITNYSINFNQHKNFLIFIVQTLLAIF